MADRDGRGISVMEQGLTVENVSDSLVCMTGYVWLLYSLRFAAIG